MTTLLSATAGRLVLRGTDGLTRFDSDEKLFQATTRATGSVSRGPWSGSYLHYQQNSGGTSWGLVAFTFYCSGGGLYLKERVLLSAATPSSPGITNTHQVLGLTFEYNLYCGSFV